MYRERSRGEGLAALAYWAAYMAGLFAMGLAMKRGAPHYELIYYALFAAGVLAVLLREKSGASLGIGGENLFIDLIIAANLVFICFCISVIAHKGEAGKLLGRAAYYLFKIALVEEIIFRGFVQSYLFGLGLGRRSTYALGAALFALIHLPFQMFVHGNLTPSYILFALPQLVFCFAFHLAMCFLCAKRQNVAVPVALHFALDYLQAVL